MNLFILSAALAVLSLASAAPSGTVFVKRDGATCNLNALSCHIAGTADTCCSPKYGLLAFDMQWLVGFGPRNTFTIHGLWPDTCSGGQLSTRDCDISRAKTDIAKIIGDVNSTLLNTMDNYWVSFKRDNNATLDPSCYGYSYVENQDVVDYFQTAINLRSQFDIYKALSSKDITPGNSYDTETIRSAINEFYGANAKLDCARGALTDVTINFYVKGKSTYQITDVFSAGTCEEKISFPAKKH